MENTDKKRFMELIVTCGEIFDKQPSEAVIRMYWQILKQYPMDKVEYAFQSVLTRREYSGFPKPADFLNIIDPPKKIEDQAKLAYKSVQDRLGRDGVYQNWLISDGLSAQVIRHYGGLTVYNAMLLGMSEKELRFHEKDFCDLYRIYSERGGYDMPQVLIGRCTGENQITGYLTANDMLAISDGGEKLALPEPEERKQIGMEE